MQYKRIGQREGEVRILLFVSVLLQHWNLKCVLYNSGEYLVLNHKSLLKMSWMAYVYKNT